MRSVLGVDVGGTKIAVGPVARNGEILAQSVVGSSATGSTEEFVQGLTGTLKRGLETFADLEPGAIGLACAGPVDFHHGVVVTSPNLPLAGTPLAEMVSAALGLPVVLENDVNAAVWGEAVCGAAAGHDNVVMVTVGTGIGGGLLIDGKVYRGAHGGAGEVGHMVVVAGGLPCLCGNRGCLEMYASGPALVRYAAAQAESRESDPDGRLATLKTRGQLTGNEVARLARQGEPGALGAVKQLAYWLGVGLVGLCNVFDPEAIVVGGGVAGLGELLLGPAREHMRLNAMGPARDTAKVVAAHLGNQAGLVGAGLLAWEVFGQAAGPGPGDARDAAPSGG